MLCLALFAPPLLKEKLINDIINLFTKKINITDDGVIGIPFRRLNVILEKELILNLTVIYQLQHYSSFFLIYILKINLRWTIIRYT